MPYSQFKDPLKESELFNSRALIALAFMCLLLVILLIQLSELQIENHGKFQKRSEKNRIDIIPLPPSRGLIYDRNGILLAANVSRFSLEIIPEQVKNLQETLDSLQKVLSIPEQNITRFHKSRRHQYRFKSIPLSRALSEKEVAKFAVNRHRFPGVDIHARLSRHYPHGQLASHILGYIGRINEKESTRIDPSNYQGTTHIGKTGVEKSYESLLHGTVGYQQQETNAQGRNQQVIKEVPALQGKHLFLTLDSHLQRVSEETLGQRRGAVVLIDIHSGDILAMASSPRFNPNAFVNGIDSKSYKKLRNASSRPLFNRALQGQYPPGSTLKPFISLAGLDLELIDNTQRTWCPGWYKLKNDDHKYRDWKRTGHGHADLNIALAQSCDVYFYDLALSLGIDNIHQYLSAFGLGTKTEIDLPAESSGLLPSRAWKKRRKKQPWYPGETLITGIGQGFMLTTPLQLATATASLARRGTLMQPRMLYAVQDPESSSIHINKQVVRNHFNMQQEDYWQQVIDGMEAVVHGPIGTARSSASDLYKMAGKTGTAQVIRLSEEKYDAEKIPEHLRDHALYIAFAPLEKPEVAISVVVENGGSGGTIAAPIAKTVLDSWFKRTH